MPLRSTKRSVAAMAVGLAITLGLFSGCAMGVHDGSAEQALSCSLIERDKRELNFSVVWHDRASAYELDLQGKVGISNRATLTASEVAAVESRFTEALFAIYQRDANHCEPDHDRSYVLSYRDASKNIHPYFLCFSGDSHLDPETQFTLDDCAARAKAILDAR